MVFNVMPFKVLASGLTDVGLVRQNNEDSWDQAEHLNFFALADGMGGHRAGEIASKEAIKALIEILNKTLGTSKEELDLSEMHGIIQYAIEYANQTIYKMGSKDPLLRGMGTTLCCLFFNAQGLVYAHVGDSRIYRLRNGKLEQLTKDDSLLRQLSDAGKINELQDQESLYKGIITKAIGTQREVDPSVHTSEVMDEDVYLMCSDGLSDMLHLKEIESLIKANPDVKKAARVLVERAKERGGFDNVTVVLVKIEDIYEQKDLP